MNIFGSKLKSEREKRGWSQEYLSKQIHVSRQSVSKWETNKNYPSIEIIIELSDLFGITIDELVRSDAGLKEKIIKDGNQWGSYVLMSLGVLIGIIVVSVLKHGEVNLIKLVKPISFTTILFFVLLLLRTGVKKVNSQ